MAYTVDGSTRVCQRCAGSGLERRPLTDAERAKIGAWPDVGYSMCPACGGSGYVFAVRGIRLDKPPYK